MSFGFGFTGIFANSIDANKDPGSALRTTTMTDAHIATLQKIINANKPGNTQFEKMSLPEALTAVNNQIDALNKKISRPIPSADEQGKLQKEIDKLQKEINKIQKEAADSNNNNNNEAKKTSIEKIKTQIAEKEEQRNFNQSEKNKLIESRNTFSEEPNKLRTSFALKMFEYNLKQLKDAQKSLSLISISNYADKITKIDACCKAIAAQLNGPDAHYITAAYAKTSQDLEINGNLLTLTEHLATIDRAACQMRFSNAHNKLIAAKKAAKDANENLNNFPDYQDALAKLKEIETLSPKIPVLSGSISDLTASEQANGQFGFTHYVKDEMGKYKKEVIKDSQGHMLTLSRDEMQRALTKWNDREKARCTATGEKFVAATIKDNFFGSGYTVKFPTSDLSSGSEKKADFIKTEMLAAANSRYDDIVEKMPTAEVGHEKAENKTKNADNTEKPQFASANGKSTTANDNPTSETSNNNTPQQ
jgi:hypothetical protein